MENKAYNQFSKFLKESGATVDEVYFRWMFEDSSAPGHKLLNWIANNITTDNYLTLREQREYNEILLSNEVLDEDELSQSFICIEKKYPGIFEISNNDESNKISEYKQLKTQIETIKRCTIDIEEIEHCNDVFNEKLSLDLYSAQKECIDLQTQCLNHKNELQYVMRQIQKLCDKNKNGQMFLSQLDVDLLIQKLHLFRSYIKLYLEQQFPQNENSKHDKTDLIMLYNRFIAGVYNDAYYEIENEAWKDCLQRLPTIHKQMKSISNIDSKLRFVTMSIENLQNEQDKYLRDLKDSAEKFTLSKLMKVKYDDNQCKLVERQLSQDKLIKLETLFKDYISLYEILLYMLSKEGNYIEQVQTIYKDVQIRNKSLERNVKLRIFDINNLLKDTENTDTKISRHICNWLVNLMQNSGLSFKSFEAMSEIIPIYNKLQMDNNAEIYLFQDQLNLLLSHTKKCNKIINDQGSLLYCDISKFPISTNFVHYSLYKYTKVLYELESLVIEKKNTFTRKKQAIDSNKLLESLYDLWIDFLCEPSKVHALIKNMKTAIQNSSRLINRSRI